MGVVKMQNWFFGQLNEQDDVRENDLFQNKADDHLQKQNNKSWIQTKLGIIF